MTDLRKILGIAGGLRKASCNRLALLAVQDLLPAGVQLDIVGLDAPAPFNQDTESSPAPELVDFKKAIRAADAILFATLEYNYGVPGVPGVPGVLKNAIDCASRPYGDSAWVGKPVDETSLKLLRQLLQNLVSAIGLTTPQANSR